MCSASHTQSNSPQVNGRNVRAGPPAAALRDDRRGDHGRNCGNRDRDRRRGRQARLVPPCERDQVRRRLQGRRDRRPPADDAVERGPPHQRRRGQRPVLKIGGRSDEGDGPVRGELRPPCRGGDGDSRWLHRHLQPAGGDVAARQHAVACHHLETRVWTARERSHVNPKRVLF